MLRVTSVRHLLLAVSVIPVGPVNPYEGDECSSPSPQLPHELHVSAVLSGEGVECSSLPSSGPIVFLKYKIMMKPSSFLVSVSRCFT